MAPKPRDPKVPAHRYSEPSSLVKPELKALFERIGGEHGLTDILIDFYSRMARDVLIGFFFAGRDVDQIAMKQKSFLLRAFGAATSYAGKAPADAHEKLPPILRGHFDRRLQLLEETLRAHRVSDEDIRTWVGFENAFRDQIVSS